MVLPFLPKPLFPKAFFVQAAIAQAHNAQVGFWPSGNFAQVDYSQVTSLPKCVALYKQKNFIYSWPFSLIIVHTAKLYFY